MAKQTDTITWLQVHNFLPIAGLIIGGIMGYSAIVTSNAVQDEKINQLNSAVSVCRQQAKANTETINDVLGAMLTPSPTLTPTPIKRLPTPSVIPSKTPTPKL